MVLADQLSLEAELNPICHLLALLRAHPILHVSSIRVNLTYLRYPLTAVHSVQQKSIGLKFSKS